MSRTDSGARNRIATAIKRIESNDEKKKKSKLDKMNCVRSRIKMPFDKFCSRFVGFCRAAATFCTIWRCTHIIRNNNRAHLTDGTPRPTKNENMAKDGEKCCLLSEFCTICGRVSAHSTHITAMANCAAATVAAQENTIDTYGVRSVDCGAVDGGATRTSFISPSFQIADT